MSSLHVHISLFGVLNNPSEPTLSVTCGKDASPESPRSKFAVVGCSDRLAHHTLQFQVCMYKVCHRTQYNVLQMPRRRGAIL